MNTETLYDIFLERSKPEYAGKPYAYSKKQRGAPFTLTTYGEFTVQARAFASALESHGISNGERVLISSESGIEWLVADFGCILTGAISVPVFPTLSVSQLEYVLQHSEAVCAIVSTSFQLRKILSADVPSLRIVIVLDGSVELPRDTDNRSFFHFSDFIAASTGTLTPRSPALDDVVTIIYTSGTTGIPKGVMLTHKNLVSNLRSAIAAIPEVTPEDLFLSFLPLSHAFERIASYLVFAVGVQVAFAESIDTVAENMLEMRPTVMTAVPRFFERVWSRIERSTDSMSPLQKKIFNWAIAVGSASAVSLEGGRTGLRTMIERPIADKLVLSKIRARTGGRIRFFVSGGAALDKVIARKFAGLGLIILEGYGLTETSPVVAVSKPDRLKWGSVGPALPGVELKIADDGEILIRGDNVMAGYYRDPEGTTEMIDTDGWLHSGDIGQIDNEGRLSITDRKKHLIILANGKNIAPAPIESLLERSPYIDQAVIVGDSKDHCSALIVAAEQMLDASERYRSIETEISKVNRMLGSYEKIRKFEIVPEAFTVENGLLTPTLKIKRKEVERLYKPLIEKMYSTE